MRLIALATLAILLSGQAPQKDRKDYIIEAVVAQRDEALAKHALCSADLGAKIAELQKEIEDLKAKKETN